MSYRPYFSRALGRPGAPLHFAAHSHHPWPDVTLDAQRKAWEDAQRLLDTKWEKVFGQIRPLAQDHVARRLNLSDPRTVVFAQNTHEFLLRLLSCLPADRPVRILSTDSEFHSFTRQTARLEEDGLVAVTRVPTQPFDSFAERFAEAAGKRAPGGEPWDLVWFSHVFFNSGWIVRELRDIVAAVPDQETVVVVDGYHSFMAIPVDFAPLEKRAFYTSGGYKYAMSGEGVCFLHCPPGYGARPRNTGWYAAFENLAQAQGDHVPYAEDAGRFAGATFDPTGLYRFTAAMDFLDDKGLSVRSMQTYCRKLQDLLVDSLVTEPLTAVHSDELVVRPDSERCGRFLTFETPHAAHIHKDLMARRVITDYRGERLRIGFGIYQSEGDVARLVDHLKQALER